MANLEETYQNYTDTTSFRLSIENLIKPLADKFNPINAQLDSLRKGLLTCEYKTAEIEVFLRHVSFFNQGFEILWKQVQELESFKEILNDRRQDDMQKINHIIEEINAELKNRSDDFRIGMNHIDVISKQLKVSIQTILTHRQASNEKISAIEVNINDIKEHFHNNIDSFKINLNKMATSIEKNIMQYAETEANIDVIKQQLKGRL